MLQRSTILRVIKIKIVPRIPPVIGDLCSVQAQDMPHIIKARGLFSDP